MPEGVQRRLAGRNGEIWQAYTHGTVAQEKLAEQFGLSQSAISKILAKVRESMPAPVIEEIRQLEAERTGVVYEQMMKILLDTHPVVSLQRGEIIEGVEDVAPKIAAAGMILRTQERTAKAYGLDAATKVETSGTVKFEIVGVDVDQI